MEGRLDSSLEIRSQGNYNLTNFYLQNFIDTTIEVKIGEIIGRIFVGCNDDFVINPCSQRRDELIQILDAVTNSQINVDNFSMVIAISDMLESQQLSHKKSPSRLLNKDQKSFKIKKLISQIKSEASVQMDLDDKIRHVNFNKLRGKLNTILLSQYMMSNGHTISQGDLQHIQNTDRDINALKRDCKEGHKNYVLKNGVLYKKGIILGQPIFKLVLPTSLSRQVLVAIHLKHETHQNTAQLAEIFGSTFHTRNLRVLAMSVVDSCILCKLCTKQGRTSTGGEHRTHDSNQVPGRIWISDMAYLLFAKWGINLQ